MIVIDDRNIPEHSDGMEIIHRVGRRPISVAIHDVDGTHSLIRDWPPVMSICLDYVVSNGLPADFDSEANKQQLVKDCGARPLPETDRFCVESAGLSALTQMEWAIRRGLQKGAAQIPDHPLTEGDIQINNAIVQGIWSGIEVFGDVDENPAIRAYLANHVPRLFRLYEEVLCRANRDKNLTAARDAPEPWRVPGSSTFLQRLHSCGVKNYFVTGAVVRDENGQLAGMYDEVVALGYQVGPGAIVEGIYGSEWDRKITKIEAVQGLINSLGIKSHNILIVGDGRSEIHAAAQLGAVAISRLDGSAQRQREIHRQAGTNYIVTDYTIPNLTEIFCNARLSDR